MSEIFPPLTSEEYIRLECLRLLADAPLSDLPKKAAELAEWVISGSTGPSHPKAHPNVEGDKREACDKIASIISSLYDRHGLAPLNLRLGTKPDFRNSGTQWDGSVHLTIGA